MKMKQLARKIFFNHLYRSSYSHLLSHQLDAFRLIHWYRIDLYSSRDFSLPHREQSCKNKLFSCMSAKVKKDIDWSFSQKLRTSASHILNDQNDEDWRKISKRKMSDRIGENDVTFSMFFSEPPWVNETQQENLALHSQSFSIIWRKLFSTIINVRRYQNIQKITSTSNKRKGGNIRYQLTTKHFHYCRWWETLWLLE